MDNLKIKPGDLYCYKQTNESDYGDYITEEIDIAKENDKYFWDDNETIEWKISKENLDKVKEVKLMGFKDVTFKMPDTDKIEESMFDVMVVSMKIIKDAMGRSDWKLVKHYLGVLNCSVEQMYIITSGKIEEATEEDLRSVGGSD